MSIFLAPGPCSLPSCAVRCVTCGPRHRVDSMGPSPPGPVALLGCTVHRVVRGPLHGAGPTDLCRGPRPPELGSTFLGPRCPAGSLPSAPGPAPSEAARLRAPSVPGQGEVVLLPTWEQEGRMRSPALPSAYLQNQAPHSGAVSSHGGLQNPAPHSGASAVTEAQAGGVTAALQPLLARPGHSRRAHGRNTVRRGRPMPPGERGSLQSAEGEEEDPPGTLRSPGGQSACNPPPHLPRAHTPVHTHMLTHRCSHTGTHTSGHTHLLTHLLRYLLTHGDLCVFRANSSASSLLLCGTPGSI